MEESKDRTKSEGRLGIEQDEVIQIVSPHQALVESK
jgi:hypothetical protein